MMDGEIPEHPTFSRRIVGGVAIDTSLWPTPDEGALSGDKLAKYLARKDAVSLFLDGASAEAIRKSTGFSAKHAYRLVRERCNEPHSDGRPWGWRALVPGMRVRPNKRIKKIHVDSFGRGGANAFQAILDLHPDLRAALNARILHVNSGKALTEVKPIKKSHHRWFLDELRALGYEMRSEYPFTTDSRAYDSICRYVDDLRAKHPKAKAGALGGPELQAKLRAGDGANRPISHFMQRVEMDAHMLDGRFCVSVPLVEGGYRELIVHRLWVIVLIEVVSRAVLGYYLSMRLEVSRVDVLRAIKRALKPWVQRSVSFSDQPYLPGSGLLSAAGKEFVGLCWDETSVDGALAMTCDAIREPLRRVVGSALLDPQNSYAKRHSKDDRPNIEAYFRSLAGHGFQRMSNTTGAKISEVKGRKPEQVALTNRFQYEYAEELLDVLVANYNASPNSGIGYRSPLEYAKFLYEHSAKNFRRVNPGAVETWFSIRKLCKVCGGANQGRKPNVDFYNANYSGDALSCRDDLVGKKVWVINHDEDDARYVRATTTNGMPIGTLRAAPPWDKSPHSLYVRSAICKAARKGSFNISREHDPIAQFLEFSEFKGKLPVYPAYLEARRILEEAAMRSIGKEIFEEAIKCGYESAGKKIKSKELHKEGSELKNKLRTDVATGDLPPPRMTATR